MKKRILSTAVALAACVSVLGGCSSKKDDTEGTEPVICDLTGELSELQRINTLPKDYINSELKALSDEESSALKELLTARENELSGSRLSGTALEERDWSKYSSVSVKDRLSAAEAALFDRLYTVCEKYLNDPSHTAKQGNVGYISYGTVRCSDLELTDEQIKNVFWWFKYNEPQFYFLDGAAYNSAELFITVCDFAAGSDDLTKTTNELFGKLDGWIAECSDDENTVWDMITSANRKICENTVYSPDAAEDKDRSVYSVLMTEDTVCTGYALTFTAMANAMGIDTYTVTGGTHAWNAAKFADVKYYYVDVCLNDEDNGYNEGFIGVGSGYAAYKDNGTKTHALGDHTAVCAPGISAANYEGSENTGKLTAPKLGIGSIGNNMVKVEWDAAENVEKYEYSVSNGNTVYSDIYTKDNFLYAVLPDRVVSATVKVRAISFENGKYVYSGYSEIIISAEGSESKPDMPANVNADSSDGIRITWDEDEDIDGRLLICYGEDSTFTMPRIIRTLEKDTNGISWDSSWQPEKNNYFSITSIKRSGNVETYSDPVLLKFNIKEGVTLLTGSGNMSGNLVTKAYSNGVYVGEMSDDKANGHGTFTWDSGDVYEGEWKNDRQNGFGKMTWANGIVYEGEWTDDRINGQGTMTWENGDVYEGEWKDGTIVSGIITNYMTNGVYIYESGNFIDNNMNGQSTRTIKYSTGDVSVLSGYATDGEINGEGTLKYTFAGGTYFLYEGELFDSLPYGQGEKTTYYTDGTHLVESGEFRDELYNGTYTLYNRDNTIRTENTYVNGRVV